MNPFDILGFKNKPLYLDYRSLGLFRIFFGSILFFETLIRLLNVETLFSQAGLCALHLHPDSLYRIQIPSIYMLTENTSIISALIAIQLLITLFFILGYRIRLACPILLYLTIALNTRISYFTTGADYYYPIYLFWSCFLPLGAEFSIDKFISNEKNNIHSEIDHFVTLGIFCQITMSYFFAGLNKSGPTWQNGSAIGNVLLNDFFHRPIASSFLAFPNFNLYMTTIFLVLETWGAFLLLLPIGGWKIRTLLILSFTLFHAAMGNLLHIGNLPWVAASVWLMLIPKELWEKIYVVKIQSDPFQTKTESRQLKTRIMVLGFAILFALSGLNNSHPGVVTATARKWTEAVGLQQEWIFFSPDAKVVAGWIQFKVKKNDGQWIQVVPFSGEESAIAQDEKPVDVFEKTFGNRMWQKLANFLVRTKEFKLRPYFDRASVNYFCHRYEAFQIIYFEQFLSAPGLLGPPSKRVLSESTCQKTKS